MWRSVQCTYCAALVSKTELTVHRESFQQALKRQQASDQHHGSVIQLNHYPYCVLKKVLSLPGGLHYSIAKRSQAGALLVLLKTTNDPTQAQKLSVESQNLQKIHQQTSQLSGHYSRMIPALVDFGVASDQGTELTALAMTCIAGAWGSLSHVVAHQASGVEARHMVWMWRRLLDILAYLHDLGWSYGAITPDTVWVNPQDHGLFLMDWSSAKQASDDAARCVDLMRSAELMRVVLSGAHEQSWTALNAPKQLVHLLQQVSQEADFCQRHGARGIDALLQQVALDAFGPPRFIEFKV